MAPHPRRVATMTATRCAPQGTRRDVGAGCLTGFAFARGACGDARRLGASWIFSLRPCPNYSPNVSEGAVGASFFGTADVAGYLRLARCRRWSAVCPDNDGDVGSTGSVCRVPPAVAAGVGTLQS